MGERTNNMNSSSASPPPASDQVNQLKTLHCLRPSPNGSQQEREAWRNMSESALKVSRIPWVLGSPRARYLGTDQGQVP